MVWAIRSETGGTHPNRATSRRIDILNRDRINCACGILPKRSVGSKRKVFEILAHGPHGFHKFSTAASLP
jgi:hypothetical protein